MRRSNHLPRFIFFVKGKGTHPVELISFNLALRDAGIENYNLVPVSSICPPGCRIISPIEGIKLLSPGEIVFCVLARQQTNIPGQTFGAAIGAAIPPGNQHCGYIGEYCTNDKEEGEMGEIVQRTAAQMLAGKLNLPINNEIHWEEQKQFYLTTGKIAKLF
ncbi:MAG: arginine decarboxylase, pyruvoyl-dependent, partial [Acidobacteria bacterium]|nr:arginine decarboxylase, pyruvoyl-dependent [Acidobacteriota bacterium]